MEVEMLNDVLMLLMSPGVWIFALVCTILIMNCVIKRKEREIDDLWRELKEWHQYEAE